jgi:transcription-repair coupling factor (superfamily II helicase)
LESDYVSDNVERLNLYRKLAGATKEQEIDDWEEELKDRFGALPQAAHNLIMVAKIKLFASQNLFTKITVRSNRMWLVCPKQKSELGVEFYENRFQPLLKTLQQKTADTLNVVQKNNRVRFVVSEISGLEAAVDFLKSLTADAKKEKAIA